MQRAEELLRREHADLQLSAKKLVQCIRPNDPMPLACLSEVQIEKLSKSTTLNYIWERVESSIHASELEVHSRIVYIEAALRNPHGINLTSLDTTSEISYEIQRWVIDATSPSPIFSLKSEFDPNPQKSASALELSRFRLRAVAGLRILARLHALSASSFFAFDNPQSLNPDLVTCLASYASPLDPWTLPSATTSATTLLKALITTVANDPKVLPTLLTNILSNVIKPRFAKSNNPSITTTGRKAAFPLPTPTDYTSNEHLTKPWKFQDIYIVTVFGWVLDQLSSTTLPTLLPLIVPPLLTILDDETTANKVRGCSFLQTFLGVVPADLLKRTGLGEVFTDALMPCLSYLPTLTPEEESIELLGAVYPALLALVRTRFIEAGEEVGKGSTGQGDVASSLGEMKLGFQRIGEKGKIEREGMGSMPRARLSALDKILRVGVLKGMQYAGEFVRIATLLVEKAGDIVEQMGVWAVKHLKDLIPLITNILSAPFGPAHPPLLLAAAVTMGVIILNCRPRIGYYRGEVLKGLVVCWCTINEEERESLELNRVKDVLKQDMHLLRTALGTDSEDAKEIDGVLESDVRFRGLLSP